MSTEDEFPLSTAAMRLAADPFRLLVESVTDYAIYVVDPAGLISSWNSGAERIYGYTALEVIGQPFDLMFSPADRAAGKARREMGAALSHGNVEEERLLCRKDGSLSWALASITTLREGDRHIGFGVVVRDISERKRDHDALQEIQQRLELAAKSAHIGIWDWDLETDEFIWDEQMYKLYGIPEGGFRDAHEAWKNGLHPDDRARSEAAIAAALHGDEGFHTEFRIVRPDGEVRDIEAHAHVKRKADGSATNVVGINLDITDRKQAERGLRLRNRAIQAVSQGILITDPNLPDNPIIYASSGFERMTGYTSLNILGRNCRFLQGKETDPATIRVMKEAIEAGRECSVEVLNYKLDGTPFWNALFITPVRDDAGKLVHFVGVQADVTERRSLERSFQQAQKMEAIGRLAGGVAHDFNNLLTVISGFSDLLLMQMPESSPQRELVVAIREAGEQAARLTRQLLAFSRKQVIAPVVLDLNDVVTQTNKMLTRLLGEDITIATILSPKLPPVKVDPGQIDQVVMNLCVNARDAMPTGGRLTIETKEFQLEEELPSYPDLAPGRYAQLSVTDTGHGMTEEVKAQIFEPFFTTKEPGKGTGLGLATVFGIIKQSHGRISVYSEVGIGTSFKILFPAADFAPNRASDSGESGPLRGTETILLVDDEDGVRSIARIALETQGYKVLDACGGADAIQKANQYSDTIHLLISDVVMPEMSGRQLADSLRSRDPKIKVLFMSGYTDDAVIRHGIIEQTRNFLQKPFAPLGLVKKVRAVLNEN